MSSRRKEDILSSTQKSKINHPNVINLFVPYFDMHKYLNVADIALVAHEVKLRGTTA